MMAAHEVAAGVGAVLIGGLVLFQLALAAGAPLGAAAWGGRHRVLPRNLRWSSLMAVAILLLAGWGLLARADLMHPGPEETVIRIASWVLAAYFALNTAANLGSKSKLERLVMTPVAAALVVCFAIVSLS